jgi:hypothetical protein
MKKKLINPVLESELRGGSVFFRRDTDDTPTAVQEEPAEQPAPVSTPAPETTEPKDDVKQASSPELMTSRHHDSMTSRYHDRLIEDIRKAVKVVGREPGTIRLTEQEKSQLTDIIYTVGRQGTRTSDTHLA